MIAITVSAIIWLVGFGFYVRLHRKWVVSQAELALADRHAAEVAASLAPVKCPACAGTGRTTSYQKQHVCPWCEETGKVTPSVSLAFDRILTAIKHPFTDVFGTTNYKNKKIR